MIKWLQDKLSHKWTLYFIVIMAIALVAPSLNVGWHLDDYFHRLLLDPQFEYDSEVSPLEIFQFLDGSPDKTKELMDLGVLPWWSSPNLKASFWRPISAITHWVDYQLWPTTASLMHAQSILWFGALVLVVGLFYRRIMSVTWVAGLAVLLFAIDDAHGNAIGWLANRNVLVTALFGIAALLVHDRWRRNGWRIGSILGPLLFLISLLAKESGIAIVAYLTSYAIFIDQGTRKNRLLSLLPYIAIVLVWRIVWVYLGHGVAGMDLYTDPLAEPIRYIGLFLARAPILLFGQYGFLPSDLSLLLKDKSAWIHMAISISFLTILLIQFVPLLRRNQVARFWALGMILSLLPATTTVPSDRLLFFVGLGAMGLLAQFFHQFVSNESIQPQKRLQLIWTRGLLITLVVLHLLIPLGLLPLRAGNPLGTQEILNLLYVRTPFEKTVENQDLIIVNAPSFLHAAYLGSMRLTNGQPVPRRLRILSTGFSAVNLFRLDERTIIVKPTGGFFQGMFDLLYRTKSELMQVGETVILENMIIEVIAVSDDGYPVEVSFHFDVPLENDSLLWLQYTNGEFVYMVPPAIGEQVQIPASNSILPF